PFARHGHAARPPTTTHLNQREFDQAIFRAQRVVQIDPENGMGFALLGEALFHQGRFAEAEAQADRALEILKGGPARNAATGIRPRTRAMLSLAPRAARVFQGAELPADGPEAIGFAEYFTLTRQFAAAARMYADALARDPALASDPVRSYRYEAACAAAL